MLLYARLNRETGRKQTIYAHAFSVGDLCAKTLAPLGLSQLGRLIGYLHDMGKAAAEFQDYLLNNRKELRGKINHSYCGTRFLNNQVKTLGANYPAFMSTMLCACILGHHGRGLIDLTAMDGTDVLSKKISANGQSNYQEAVENFTAQCFSKDKLRALIKQAVHELKFFLAKAEASKSVMSGDHRCQFHFFLSLTCRLIHSCLVDADRYDAYCFENNITPDACLPLPWAQMAQSLDVYCGKKFQNNTKNELNDLRTSISDACFDFAARPGGIYRLPVPTGGGKTITAMRYALHHAAQHDLERIFYIAPFRVILSQNASIYREALGNPALVLEHHGDAIAPVMCSTDVLEDHELLLQRWSGNRVILTSMVQFLNTLFHGKASCSRRFHTLASAVVILDEVQSLPPRFVAMFNSACDFLAECCNCTIILCTATQPAFPNTNIPIRLSEPMDMVPLELFTSPVFKRVEVQDHTALEMNAEKVADIAKEKCADGLNTMIILNTKSDTKNVLMELQKGCDLDGRVFLLNADLCPQHRMDVLQNVRKRLDDDTSKPIICVSTQLIEAGVDISFDFVMRSLCGLDSIAQAAGRCNRNGKDALREVWIIKVAGEDERLAYLPEILDARDASKQALIAYSKNPGAYGHDLLHPSIIEVYYQYYYNNADALLYPVSPSNKNPDVTESTTLYDLLSGNKTACKNSLGKPHAARYMQQSFRTAGYAMEAIESTGYDVLVPYGETGQKLISEIEDYQKCFLDMEGKQVFQWLNGKLKEAQRYIVHIYPGTYKELQAENALRSIGPTETVLALSPGYYDDVLGVRTEAGELSV